MHTSKTMTLSAHFGEGGRRGLRERPKKGTVGGDKMTLSGRLNRKPPQLLGKCPTTEKIHLKTIRGGKNRENELLREGRSAKYV